MAHWRRSIAVLGAVALSSCVAPRTQIVVVVDTDYNVTSEVGALRVTVTDPGGGENTVRAITLSGSMARGCTDAPMPTRFCIPLSFLLVPKTGRVTSAPVNITVEAVAGTDGMSGHALVSRSARLPFAMGQTLRLPMFLPRACEGVVCGDGLTCVEGGRCVPVDQPPGVSVIDPVTGLSIDASRDSGVSVEDASVEQDASLVEDTGITADSAMMADAMMGMPDVMGGMPDVMTGMPDVMTGMPDVMTGMPDVMTGMPDVMMGMPDVMTGMPDVMSGMPDVMSGMPDSGARADASGGAMDAGGGAIDAGGGAMDAGGGGSEAGGGGGRDSGADEETGRRDR